MPSNCKRASRVTARDRFDRLRENDLRRVTARELSMTSNRKRAIRAEICRQTSKERGRVLVGGSRQRSFIRSRNRLIVLQKGKETVESKPMKASSPEDTSQ